MAEVPTLGEVIRDAISARLDEVHTTTVGRIVKYDPLTQTADVQPVMRRAYPIGQGLVDFEDLPIIPNVPVKQPRSGGFFMHMPVKSGDHVQIDFTHDDIANWRTTGASAEPDDLRRHSLGSCIATPGMADAKNPLPITDPLEVAARAAGPVLGKEGSIVQIQFSDNGISFGRPAVSPIALAVPTDAAIAQLQAEIVALTGAVTALQAGLVAALSALGSHTHTVAATPGPTSPPVQAPPSPPSPPPAPGAAPPSVASTLVKSI